MLKPLQTEVERSAIVEHLYSPLEQSWETRMLGLQPGAFYDPLVATLDVATFVYATGVGLAKQHRTIEYEALSYTWGGETFSHPLVCNGHSIGITRNLSTALRQLRWTNETRYIWADAVCINQTDNNEKARQIRLLITIFQRAKQVIAWLGEETPLAATALSHMHHSAEIKSGLSHSEDFCRGVLSLLSKPWFSRAWVVQEVFAAKSLKVQCGQYIVDWESFRDLRLEVWSLKHELQRRVKGQDLGTDILHGTLWRNFGSFDPRAESLAADFLLDSTLTSLDFLHEVEQSQRRPQKFNLYRAEYENQGAGAGLQNLLRGAAHLKATDPRDKIWSLLALTDVAVEYASVENRGTMGSDLGIRVDYTVPAERVFAEVTRYLLASMRRDVPKPRSLCDRGPSWSIDFTSSNMKELDGWRGGLHFATVPWLDAVDWQRLSLVGIQVGTVVKCREKMNLGDLEDRLSPDRDLSFASDQTLRLCRRAGKSSDFVSYVDVTLASPLRSWILDQAGSDLTFAELAPSDRLCERARGLFVEDSARSSTYGAFSQFLDPELVKDRLGLRKRKPRLVPIEKILAYLEQDHLWTVIGDVQPQDILVHNRKEGDAIVLRPRTGPGYMYIGSAVPTYALRLRKQTAEIFETRDPKDIPEREKRYSPGVYPEPNTSHIILTQGAESPLLEGAGIFDVY